MVSTLLFCIHKQSHANDRVPHLIITGLLIKISLLQALTKKNSRWSSFNILIMVDNTELAVIREDGGKARY